VFFKNIKFLCLNFFIFLNYFDVLTSKIIFKKYKKYSNAFSSKKQFEKQLLSYSQTSLSLFGIVVAVAFQSSFYLKIHQNNIFFILLNLSLTLAY